MVAVSRYMSDNEDKPRLMTYLLGPGVRWIQRSGYLKYIYKAKRISRKVASRGNSKAYLDGGAEGSEDKKLQFGMLYTTALSCRHRLATKSAYLEYR